MCLCGLVFSQTAAAAILEFERWRIAAFGMAILVCLQNLDLLSYTVPEIRFIKIQKRGRYHISLSNFT